MKTSSLALFAVLASASDNADAFAPPTALVSRRILGNGAPTTASLLLSEDSDATSALLGSFGEQLCVVRTRNTHLWAGAGFLGMEEDDEDEEDDDDDDDEEDVALSSSRRYSGAKSPFTGMKLDPWDPNPLIKPRPSRYFRDDKITSDPTIPDDQLVQTMSPAERGENLQVMRQIRKSDLPDLRRRKDHAGWVEANNDLNRRLKKDPWFGVNERLRDAMQLGEPDEKILYLQQLAARLGGPPPGITIGSIGYAVHTEIYDIGLSPAQAAAIMEREIRAERAARGRAMMAERKKNMEREQRQYEEDMRNPGVREDKEARERRERTMKRLMAEIEEDQKKKAERAKEILGKVPETPESRTKSMEKALREAREEVKKFRRQQLGKNDTSKDAAGAGLDEATKSRLMTGADKAREAAAQEASGGRPRLPGDPDVTRGELPASVTVESSSTTITGPLQVEVTSAYNKEQSDPPMRKHCFQYTIRITNNSAKDTIQLLGRRFEIQTVGSSMKDIVQGEGVTGRTPILKPGEVFEYTSTAPLSVRPIGTTIIAARMRGEYRYVVLKEGQQTASEDQVKAGGEATAELGTFHFVFPEDQRVKPFKTSSADDDDEEDDDEVAPAIARSTTATRSTASAAPATPATAPATSAPSPASTLPGDQDMKTGDITVTLNDSSEAITESVRVHVSSSYRPERSDAALDKHCFAYNIRITNESPRAIQLISRRFEIQTIGSALKDVVQGPGVTGRQPILKPGESFEYTSTAPLSVKPKLEKTPVVARMQGEYNFVILSDDGTTPLSSESKKANLGLFHFILPALV